MRELRGAELCFVKQTSVTSARMAPARRAGC